MESTVEKREFGFLWRIIGVYLTIVVANVLVKSNAASIDQGLTISAGIMTGLAVLMSVLYAIKLKPVMNQLIVFILCIGVTFAAIVFYVYNLPYKNVLGFLSLPLVLILCGMWMFVRFAKEEV